MKTELSIIIPVYKVEDYIRRCLDSIYSQNVKEELYEVITIDDGSPDKSMVIVEEFAESHKNLTIISQKNQGLSVARNTGLQHAKGRYVWFVDSDDWIANDSLFTILNIITKQEYDIISSDVIKSYDDSSRNHAVERDRDRFIPSYKYLLDYPVGLSQRFVLNRQFLIDNELSFYPGIYHEDAEFGMRMIAKSCGVLHIKKHLYHYFQRSTGGIMSSWKLKNTQDYCFVSKRVREFMKEIDDKKIKRSLQYYSLKTHLQAFPRKQVTNIQEVNDIYVKEKNVLRKEAFSLLWYRFPLHKKLSFIACIITPMLVLKEGR